MRQEFGELEKAVAEYILLAHGPMTTMKLLLFVAPTCWHDLTMMGDMR